MDYRENAVFLNIFQNLSGFAEYRLPIQTIIVILRKSSEEQTTNARGIEMKCHTCKTGTVTTQDIATDGIDAVCLKCINRKHVAFMNKMAKRGIKMNCVKGCHCGFGR